MLVIMHYALFIRHYTVFGTHSKLSNFWVASDLGGASRICARSGMEGNNHKAIVTLIK